MSDSTDGRPRTLTEADRDDIRQILTKMLIGVCAGIREAMRQHRAADAATPPPAESGKVGLT